MLTLPINTGVSMKKYSISLLLFLQFFICNAGEDAVDQEPITGQYTSYCGLYFPIIGRTNARDVIFNGFQGEHVNVNVLAPKSAKGALACYQKNFANFETNPDAGRFTKNDMFKFVGWAGAAYVAFHLYFAFRPYTKSDGGAPFFFFVGGLWSFYKSYSALRSPSDRNSRGKVFNELKSLVTEKKLTTLNDLLFNNGVRCFERYEKLDAFLLNALKDGVIVKKD